jgi:hypothetical protein
MLTVRTRFLAPVIACCALFLAGVPAAAQDAVTGMQARLDALFGSHAPYEDFLALLQQAVAAGNRTGVAALVSYPLKTRLAGRPVTVHDAGQFVARYEQLLPAKSREAIAQQKFEALFANSSGVMVGSGQVWFSGVCGDAHCKAPVVLITAVNP